MIWQKGNTFYATNGSVKKNEVYTIVGESTGKGATKWLKLKSGAGYIANDYIKSINKEIIRWTQNQYGICCPVFRLVQ